MTEQKYGPNTAAVEALLEELRSFTQEQWRVAGDAYDIGWAAEWNPLMWLVWSVARDPARVVPWVAAQEAVWDVAGGARDSTLVAAQEAARDAICALVVADLVPQRHVNAILAPIEAARKVQN